LVQVVAKSSLHQLPAKPAENACSRQLRPTNVPFVPTLRLYTGRARHTTSPTANPLLARRLGHRQIPDQSSPGLRLSIRSSISPLLLGDPPLLGMYCICGPSFWAGLGSLALSQLKPFERGHPAISPLRRENSFQGKQNLLPSTVNCNFHASNSPLCGRNYRVGTNPGRLCHNSLWTTFS
jgi:hypothetical protein